MDLGTIKSRIDDNLYGNKVDLIADIQLVWNNAKKFNPKTHAVYEAADFLEKFSHYPACDWAVSMIMNANMSVGRPIPIR